MHPEPVPPVEVQYLQLLRRLYHYAPPRPAARTTVPTRGFFGATLVADLQQGFPLLTTKRIPFSSVRAELQGFVRGYTSAEQFRFVGTKIWDANANQTPAWLNNPNRKGEDDLGRIYGAQWTSWRGPQGQHVNQIARLIRGLIENPFDRAHIVTAWNPGELDQMALRPCHTMFQCYVEGDLDKDTQTLSMAMYQRSADIFLGVPFNIASYALLLHMLAVSLGMSVGTLCINLGDVHLYENHEQAAKVQLRRDIGARCDLGFTAGAVARARADIAEGNYAEVLQNFMAEDFVLVNYHPADALPVQMAV